MDLSSFKCFWWAVLFLQEWRFGRSRSSKVIGLGTNRKRVCDFLLVCHSNVDPIDPIDPILHVSEILRSWPQLYSTLIWGMFPLDQFAHVGCELFSKYYNLCDHGTRTLQTARQTTYCRITPLCVASRGKNSRGPNTEPWSPHSRSTDSTTFWRRPGRLWVRGSGVATI